MRRTGRRSLQEFSTIGKAFRITVNWVTGSADLNPLYKNSRNTVAACQLFCMAIVLMNLLVRSLAAGWLAADSLQQLGL